MTHMYTVFTMPLASVGPNKLSATSNYSGVSGRTKLPEGPTHAAGT